MEEMIIDRSPEQKQVRVNKLREELRGYGYTVVTTAWLGAYVKGHEAHREREIESDLRCANGHLRTDENLYVKPNGVKQCRSCAEQSRIRYRSKMQAAE